MLNLDVKPIISYISMQQFADMVDEDESLGYCVPFKVIVGSDGLVTLCLDIDDTIYHVFANATMATMDLHADELAADGIILERHDN